METYTEVMEQYASENDVPIMQKEGIIFLQEQIKKHHVKRILEIGSAIGYSAIQMCLVDKDIEVVTIEKDEQRYLEAVKNVTTMNLQNRITLIHGDALETSVEGEFDLLFIDAAKAQYIKFFERYETHLKTGAIIVSDNLKFHGLVDNESRIKNRNTRQLVGKIKRYITFLEENVKYDTTFYEDGDGIAISIKKK